VFTDAGYDHLSCDSLLFSCVYRQFWVNSVPQFYVIQFEVNNVFSECTSTTKFYVTSISNTPTALTLNHEVERN